MEKIITVVIARNGLLKVASDSISVSDAERWAEEGFHVFRIVVRGDRWAMNHVNSGTVHDTYGNLHGREPVVTPGTAVVEFKPYT